MFVYSKKHFYEHIEKTKTEENGERRIGWKEVLAGGGGIRSLNVALRQKLDLYVCLRHVRWFKGVPSPVKRPELVDMVVFRENTEDVYAGFELEQGKRETRKLIGFLDDSYGWAIPEDSEIGIKPVSIRRSVTLVHKGNIQKFSERTIEEKIVTYDFARLMEGAREVKCSEFADAVIERL